MSDFDRFKDEVKESIDKVLKIPNTTCYILYSEFLWNKNQIEETINLCAAKKIKFEIAGQEIDNGDFMYTLSHIRQK